MNAREEVSYNLLSQQGKPNWFLCREWLGTLNWSIMLRFVDKYVFTYPGCGKLWVTDGIWKLTFPHCMYQVQVSRYTISVTQYLCYRFSYCSYSMPLREFRVWIYRMYAQHHLPMVRHFVKTTVHSFSKRHQTFQLSFETSWNTVETPPEVCSDFYMLLLQFRHVPVYALIWAIHVDYLHLY